MTKKEIQFIRSLAQRSARESEGLFIAEGEKLIEELVGSQLNVEQIYTTNDELVGDGIEHVSPAVMERISQLKSANNSLALVEIPRHTLSPQSLEGRLSIALDDIQNPGNLGTIIRLADWFGIEDIIASRSTVDCFNPKVVQATMGAISRVRVHYCDIVDMLKSLSNNGLPIYGTYLEGENIYSSQLSQNGVIVMGNEGQGISKQVGEVVNRKLLIPSYPADSASGESLNVAIATAIVCSEFRRR
ncbi:MAG: RNA methyltransferase [Rikenellaceae bacterium]